MDISKISIIKEEFTYDFDSIGKVSCCRKTLGGMQEISKRIGNIKEASSDDYVKALITVTCHPVEEIENREYIGKGFSFEMSDLDECSDDELEGFATQFLESHQELFKKRLTLNIDDESKSDFGEILHPQEENELQVEYLHRLSILEEEIFLKPLRTMTEKITGFSSGIQKQVGITNKTMERMYGSFKPFQDALAKSSIEIQPRQLPLIDTAEHFDLCG